MNKYSVFPFHEKLISFCKLWMPVEAMGTVPWLVSAFLGSGGQKGKHPMGVKEERIERAVEDKFQQVSLSPGHCDPCLRTS